MSVITYTCPHCGGNLKFDPETQKSKCEFCLSTFTEEELEASAAKKLHSEPVEEIIEDASDYQTDAPEDAHLLSYTCPSCGAQIVTEETTSATICYYCHNPVVLSKQVSGAFKPSKVIPFKYSSDQAVEAFLAWCKKHWFLPKDFSSPSQLEKISGLYVPYWLVDCSVVGQLSATGTNISSWRSGNYRYTKTDKYGVYREAEMNFEYIPHDASKKAEDAIMDSIGPFHFDDLVDFSTSYLSGFLAAKYDVEKEEVYPIIKQRIENGTNTTLRSSIGPYTHVIVNRVNVNFKKTRFHYTLMPVWILTYLYKGKTYIFAMNGQTGKVYGSIPLCRSKLAGFCALIFVIIFIVCLIGGFML